jgi:hypothetical protein
VFIAGAVTVGLTGFFEATGPIAHR